MKTILGGISAPNDLRDISLLGGERDDETTTTNWGYQGKQISTSIRRVPVLGPEQIRTLPFGTAITILRTARPILTTLRTWTSRKDAALLRTQQQKTEKLLPNRGQ